MRSLAGEPDLHKKWLLFLPSGHKEKLGQGSKELGFARPNHSGLGHLVKKKKRKSVNLGHSISLPGFLTLEIMTIFKQQYQNWQSRLQKCINTEGGNQSAWLVQFITMCWRDSMTEVFLKIWKLSLLQKKVKAFCLPPFPEYVHSTRVWTAAFVALHDGLLYML